MLTADTSVECSDVTIFTYTLGEQAEGAAAIPREIACARNGIYTHIPSGSEPALYMRCDSASYEFAV